jgi:aspartate aminotransferase
MFEDGIKLKEQFGEENVYDFTLGNPNVAPPNEFQKLLIEAARSDNPGKHAYMPNAGYIETRNAIAAYLSHDQGIPLTGNHIVMTCGAGGALNVILKTLLDPGDEVIVPAPFFAEYQFYVDNHGGCFKPILSRDDFSIDFNALSEAITEHTKAVLINSPNNPTGKVYDEETIRALSSLLNEKSKAAGRPIYLISDEPYRDIVYDGIKVPSLLKDYPNSIIATSYSKTLSIPGERIGYIAANPSIPEIEKVMAGLILSNRILGFVNAPALMQRIIAGMQGITVNIEIYKRKRDLLCDGLAQIGYSFNRPQGAFYLFPKSPIPDDVRFVKSLQEKNILTVPGSGFGAPGYFRIAYCVREESIINAMPGFQEVLHSYC